MQRKPGVKCFIIRRYDVTYAKFKRFNFTSSGNLIKTKVIVVRSHIKSNEKKFKSRENKEIKL